MVAEIADPNPTFELKPRDFQELSKLTAVLMQFGIGDGIESTLKCSSSAAPCIEASAVILTISSILLRYGGGIGSSGGACGILLSIYEDPDGKNQSNVLRG